MHADSFGNKHLRPLDESYRVSIKGFSYLSTCEQVQGQVPGRDCVEVMARADGDTSSSVYTASFFLSQSGRYSVDVALFNKVSSQVETMPGGGAAQPFILEVEPTHVPGSPFRVKVVDASRRSSRVTSAAKSSVVTDMASKWIAGESVSVLVQASDTEGLDRASSGDSITAHALRQVEPGIVDETELIVVDNEDGTYSVQYTPTVATAQVIKIKVNGELIGRSLHLAASDLPH